MSGDFAAIDAGIRQLHARFLDAVWRQDAEAFSQCFAVDGQWKIATMHLHGRAEIGATAGTLLEPYERVMLLAGQPLLELGEVGTATGRVPMTELAKLKNGSSAMTIGIYYDRYLEEDGRWRFAWRHWGLHYRGPIDLSAEMVPAPTMDHRPARPAPTSRPIPAGSRSLPSYRIGWAAGLLLKPQKFRDTANL